MRMRILGSFCKYSGWLQGDSIGIFPVLAHEDFIGSMRCVAEGVGGGELNPKPQTLNPKPV